eukprot:1899601-Pyramimonas_sp.AAC.1
MLASWWPPGAPLGGISGLLGGLLEPPESVLGRKARLFGSWSPSWGRPGALWGRLGRLLGRGGALLG